MPLLFSREFAKGHRLDDKWTATKDFFFETTVIISENKYKGYEFYNFLSYIMVSFDTQCIHWLSLDHRLSLSESEALCKNSEELR